MSGVKGYKVFNPDWTCRDKQYTCPGKFEEDVELHMCENGMHFCKNAADCFNYYGFNAKNKVAEVIAYGDVAEEGDKCATNKLEIVREILWGELVEIVNEGEGCIGLNNTGCYNIGRRNTGDKNVGDDNIGNWNGGCRNSGDWNTGNDNTGNRNSGDQNGGNKNAGIYNLGNYNTGSFNTGDCNSGDHNSGGKNTGDCNTCYRNSGDRNRGGSNTGNMNYGNDNTGDYNKGSRNSGNYNVGIYNSGNYNFGNLNSGDWNKTNNSNGCFNTEEPKIFLFNKPSDWTYRDWYGSQARKIMSRVELNVKWIYASDVTDDEKSIYTNYTVTDGYLKVIDNTEAFQRWWDSLTDNERNIVKAIPNFNADIFKEITGIDVNG